MKMSAEVHPLIIERRSGVLSLILNRPQARNAINWDLRRALDVAIRVDATSPEVRVVVIRGAGSTFCAGGDIKQMGGGMADSLTKLNAACQQQFRKLAGASTRQRGTFSVSA
jgi:enoyl-CoA hydratase/carnithine racemase